jgi:hypothetical protein
MAISLQAVGHVPSSILSDATDSPLHALTDNSLSNEKQTHALISQVKCGRISESNRRPRLVDGPNTPDWSPIGYDNSKDIYVKFASGHERDQDYKTRSTTCQRTF